MKEAVLAVPLLESQIEAANRLHQHLQQWQVADKALSALQLRFPGFDMEATLLKVVVVNQLYGTNILAVTRMAEHVTTIMLSAGGRNAFDLVEQIALFSGKKHLSFASKFAHFFIDMERFPIYDSFPRWSTTIWENMDKFLTRSTLTRLFLRT
ncbi:hypothetical protein KSD_82760 [Ktedonobacter sp. SOSP1-85]|uniref:hypothetical protein n=1 Tax=Ktedonobacter sp. SOSP1-85 TaxID=2778367 RepID=UPI001915630B|nr:hypothetical protein [Ktedonobacter sp. SOSP1-85]GHO80505.1 hypothetical protein KSD_82760 [Ktedonobacter sp. SOSP1-85]